jgi:hypothetical protein
MLAGISLQAMSKRIKQINSSGEKAAYIDKRSKKGKYIANRILNIEQSVFLLAIYYHLFY